MSAVIMKEKPHTVTKKHLRNSLLELYRFLFAMWVVWYHGYFLFSNRFFDHGYLAVEFFFILSGFYFLKGMDKYKDKPFFSGLGKMLWDKVKPLGFPFVVGLVFVVWQGVLEAKPVLMGYLWYIPIMLLAFALIYTIRRLVKGRLPFVISLAAIAVVSYLILYIPIVEQLGVARGLGAVSLGVLISLIPKRIFKIKMINLNAIFVVLLFFTVLLLAFLPKENLISEYFLVLLLMPALIYFTSTLSFNFKFFNFLGSLSFLIYSYQCVLRIIKAYFNPKQYWLFIILIGMVLLTKLCYFLIKRAKNANKSVFCKV